MNQVGKLKQVENLGYFDRSTLIQVIENYSREYKRAKESVFEKHSE